MTTRKPSHVLKEHHLTQAVACSDDNIYGMVSPCSITHTHKYTALPTVADSNKLQSSTRPVTTTLPSSLQAEHFSYLSPTHKLT